MHKRYQNKKIVKRLKRKKKGLKSGLKTTLRTNNKKTAFIRSKQQERKPRVPPGSLIFSPVETSKLARYCSILSN